MEWVLQSPQIHNTFSNLGYAHTDGYQIHENCNAALEDILYNLLREDKTLRPYRRNISFGQNIKKDLIPLLICAKEDKTIELLIEIFVILTTPIECLFNLEEISKTDFGRHTIFEINNLLTAAKTALTDNRTIKVIIDFLKRNAEWEQKTKLSVQQCRNIGNTLLFLRNIIHIPDELNSTIPNYAGPTHAVQNQILWNLFSHSIDKVLIKLMTISDSASWCVTMVQLVALLYKDQHVTTLHKLLNVWLESSVYESSEDNESNTSPPGRGKNPESNESSPIITPDPTSDSSDTGACCASNAQSNLTNNTKPDNATGSDKNTTPTDHTNGEGQSKNATVTGEEEKLKNSNQGNSTEIKSIDKTSPPTSTKNENSTEIKTTDNAAPSASTKNENTTPVAENSDYGYGTQVEHQDFILTSSNEDVSSSKKPVHRRPPSTKQRPNNKTRTNTVVTSQEKKRKKIVKRCKSNIINVQGLTHSKPTDDEISNVLQEFTVDFLLKGFNALVKTLLDEILANDQLEIDKSHFFWLVTYFLKFATQIELDLEHVSSVLSFDIVSYLTAEAVNICEQFELAIKMDGNDLKPCIRRQHLVITAIREFVQAIEAYKKSAHISNEDQETLKELQMKMCETEELRSLLVLFLRCYNPIYHSKQYLQDLIVTNHILLMFMDGLMKLPEYKGTGNMIDHVKQFVDPYMMCQYGLLLEDYERNGEFVNDCIFTIMHHVGGELGSPISLFQPNIINTFYSIVKSEFEICDDWTDLVEYIMNTFVRKPLSSQKRLEMEAITKIPVPSRAPARTAVPALGPPPVPAIKSKKHGQCVKDKPVCSKRNTKERQKLRHPPDVSESLPTGRMVNALWSEDELSSLNWNYMQCNTSADFVGGIVNLFKEDGIKKSRDSVIRQLLIQCLITKEVFDNLIKKEPGKHSHVKLGRKEMRDIEIRKLCAVLSEDNKAKFLIWVQNVLLDICCAKIYLNKKNEAKDEFETKSEGDVEKTEKINLPALAPVPYHSLLYKKSIPLVPWNCEQAAICKDLKFLQLVHKLGFHMPVDTGKVFIRIPHFWTADSLYEVAAKIGPINTTKLKFSVSDISESVSNNVGNQANDNEHMDIKDEYMDAPPENFHRVPKRTHLCTIANFTPTPGCSYNDYEGKVKKSEWLEFVQESQDININYYGSAIVDYDEDVDMGAPPRPGSSSSMAPEGYSMPTIMNIKLETDDFMHHLDLDNNSLCDTASVASDLTRMYVSDGDDRSEMDMLNSLDTPFAPFEVSLHPVITEMRPREQCASPLPTKPIPDY